MMRLTLTLLLLLITITVNNAIAQTIPTRLSFHSSPVIPPPREHALTVTFEDGRIFYGGGLINRPKNDSTSEMAEVYQHDTWLYSPTTLQWSRISDTPYNTDESNRAHRINDTIYIFDWNDDRYVITGKFGAGVGMNNLTWTSLRFLSDPVPRREGSTSTLFPTNPNLILFAGGYAPNNIHTFDTISRTWTTITPITTFTTRASHALCTYQNQIFLTGGVYTESGTTQTTVYGDVWVTNDAVNWNRLTTSAFPPRWGHTLSVFSNQLFVTGGSANGVALDDVWSSVDGISWYQLATLRQPRYFHKAIDNGAGFLYILGGTYDPTNHNRPAINNEYYQGYRSIVKDVQIINQNNGLSLTWDVPFGMNPPITNFTVTIRNNNNTAEMYTLTTPSSTRQLLFSTNNIYIDDITQPHIWLVKGNTYDINITMSTDMYVGETYTAKDVRGIQNSPLIDTPIVTVDGAHDGVLSLTWSLGTHDIDAVTFPIAYTLYDSQRNIINIVNITQSDIKINQNIRYVSRDIKVMNTSTPTAYTLCVSTLFQPTERCSAPTDAVTTPPTPILLWELSSPSIDGIDVIPTKNTFPAIAWGCMITYNNTYYLMGGERVNSYGEGWLVNEIWSSHDGLIWMYQGNATWSPRAHHSCVVINDTIVVLGGLVSYGYPERPLGGSISSLYLNATGINMTSSEVWTYNNNIWTQAENIPHQQTMDTFAIVASNQSLYLIGGYDGVNNITNSMWERFMNGTWLLHPTPTFSPRYGHNGIWYHNQLYVMGGFGDVGAVQFRGARTYSDVHRYDPATGVWTALAARRLPNPSTRGWFGMTVIHDQLTIIQGFADGTSSSCNDCIRDEQWMTTDGEQWMRALPYPSKLGSIYNYPNAINIRFGFYMLTYGDEIRILGGVIPIQDSLQVNKYLTDIYTTRGGVVAPKGAPYLEQQPTIHPSRQFRLVVNPPVFPDYFYDKAKLSAYIPSSIEVTNITMWLYRVPDTSVIFGSTHVVGEQGTDGRSALALNATLIATNTSYNTASHKIILSINDNQTITWGHAYQVILIAYNSLGASHPLIMKPQYAYCRPDPIPEISVINDHHGMALIQFDSHFYGGMDIQLGETLLEYHIYAIVGNEEMEVATLNVDTNTTRYYTYIPFNINSTEDSMYLDTPIRFRIELRDINNYLKTIGYTSRLSSIVTITSDRPTAPPTTSVPTTPTPTIEPSSSNSSTGGSSSNGTSPTSSTSGTTTASPSTTSPPSTTSKPTTNSSSPSSTGPVTSIDSSSSSTAPQPNLPNTGLQHETHFLLSCVILLFTYIFAH